MTPTVRRVSTSGDLDRVASRLRGQGQRLTIAQGPSVAADVYVAHGGDTLGLLFRVQEPAVRAVAAAPNSEVYKDSCVECFITFGGTVGYYNIELNCIGTPLVGFGIDRHRRHRLPASLLSRIRTFSSLGTAPFDLRAGTTPWELVVVVPISVFAYHPRKSFDGETARANFYKCGDELPEPHYESWVPVRTPTPDFHRPEFFAPVRFS